jgi:hypothetical protein
LGVCVSSVVPSVKRSGLYFRVAFLRRKTEYEKCRDETDAPYALELWFAAFVSSSVARRRGNTVRNESITSFVPCLRHRDAIFESSRQNFDIDLALTHFFFLCPESALFPMKNLVLRSCSCRSSRRTHFAFTWPDIMCCMSRT